MTFDDNQPLAASALRKRCDPKALSFSSTADLSPLHQPVGQERALNVLSFGARMNSDSFNIFVMVPSHSGRHDAIRRFLEQKAAAEAIPDDWVFVNNFDAADRPIAIRLPSGEGGKLKAAMEELIDDLSSAIPAMFESEEYRNRRKAIDDEFETKQEDAFEELRKRAEAENIAILRTPMGFALAPLAGSKVIKPEVFSALPPADREKVEAAIQKLQEELETNLRNVPLLEKERRKKVRHLNSELATLVFGLSIKDVVSQFSEYPEVVHYLDRVRSDLITSAELFLKPVAEDEDTAFGGVARLMAEYPLFARYGVNVIVSHAGNGAPTLLKRNSPAGYGSCSRKGGLHH